MNEVAVVLLLVAAQMVLTGVYHLTHEPLFVWASVVVGGAAIAVIVLGRRRKA